MQFSLLDLEMNVTCDIMNFTHLTWLVLLHYLVKVETRGILPKKIASDDHSFIKVDQGRHVP